MDIPSIVALAVLPPVVQSFRELSPRDLRNSLWNVQREHMSAMLRILILAVTAGLACAQTFEVASIKPGAADARGLNINPEDGAPVHHQKRTFAISGHFFVQRPRPSVNRRAGMD
jgi:hypothetical protein